MAQATQQKPDYTEPDNTVRCTHCCVEAGGTRAGTPLSEITVKIKASDESFIPIAKATICRRCLRIYRVFLLPMAEKLNINRIGVGRCLKASKCADSFKINELQSGQMDEVKISESLKKIMRELSPVNYNPDKFTQSDTLDLGGNLV